MAGPDADIKVINMTSRQYPDVLDLVDRFRAEDAARHDGTLRPRALATAMLIKAGYLAYQERFKDLDGQSGR